MALILIVDDEVDLANLVDFNLRQAGFNTAIAATGAQALEQARLRAPDLILLDLMLPDLSGKEVCRRLRSDPRLQATPIVMLTARGEEADRIEGFEVGADDYVTKPFSPRELVLRVRAILRRAHPGLPTEVLSHGPLQLDLGSHTAQVDGAPLELTALEFKLLSHFLTRPGRVQTREQLLAEVWGITSSQETRTVDTHVMRLREKLGTGREAIETVRGVGYRLAGPSLPDPATPRAGG